MTAESIAGMLIAEQFAATWIVSSAVTELTALTICVNDQVVGGIGFSLPENDIMCNHHA